MALAFLNLGLLLLRPKALLSLGETIGISERSWWREGQACRRGYAYKSPRISQPGQSWREADLP